MADRVTQVVEGTLAEGAPNARVSQLVIGVLGEGGIARVSQLAVGILADVVFSPRDAQDDFCVMT